MPRDIESEIKAFSEKVVKQAARARSAAAEEARRQELKQLESLEKSYQELSAAEKKVFGQTLSKLTSNVKSVKKLQRGGKPRLVEIWASSPMVIQRQSRQPLL